MRAILDAILLFIGAESLTDLEYSSIELDSAGYNEETYAALLGVLDSRESVSSMKERLKYTFLAKGVAVEDPDSAKSNIFIGAEL